MARVRGMSIGYYPIPSDYNKTKSLKKAVMKYGSEGFHILIELDRLILNSEHGFYIENDDSTIFKLQQITGVDRKTIISILAFSISIDYYNKILATTKERKIFTNSYLMKTFLAHTKKRKGLPTALNNLEKLATLGNIKITIKKKKTKEESITPKPVSSITKEDPIKQEETLTTIEEQPKHIYTKYKIQNKTTYLLLKENIISLDEAQKVDLLINDLKQKHRTINTFFKFKIPQINRDYLDGKIFDIGFYLKQLYMNI